MNNDESAVLDLSDDPKPNKKEEKKSFWESKMENIPKEAFKKGAMKPPKSSTSKGKKEEETTKSAPLPPDDSKRQRLIRLHNSYLTSSTFYPILKDAGYPCQIAPPNTTLPSIQVLLGQIDEILGANQGTRMATKMMQAMNQGVEFFIPELKFGEHSLSAVFDEAVSTPGSQLNQDMEELGLHMRPYAMTNFWGRFFSNYASFVWELREMKKRGTVPQSRTNATKDYNAFENLNEKYEGQDL